MLVSTAPLGFSIRHGLSKVGHGIKRGVHETGHLTKKYGAYALAPVLIPMKLIGEPLVKLALRPVRTKVRRLKDRRAKKLAWDRRKSTVPTPAENNEAKGWTKSKVKGEIPFGPLLSALAGPPSFFGPPEETVMMLGQIGQFGEVVTAATISASVPIMLALMDHIMGKHAASGEAPVDPRGGPGGAGGGGAPGAPGADGGAGGDPAAAADAGGGGADDGSGGDAGGGGGGGGKGGKGGGMVKLPGGMKVKRHTLIIGAVVVGGIVLVILLTSPKKKD